MPMASNDFVPPTSEQIETVRKELNADENSITSAISILKGWLLKQPHLPNSIGNIYLLIITLWMIHL